MDPSSLIPTLLGIAVLLPLASFVVILCTARYLKEQAAWVAICAIGGACLLSFISMFLWLGSNWPKGPEHGHSAGHSEAHEARGGGPDQYFVSTAEEDGKESPTAEKEHPAPSASATANAPTKPGPYTGDAILPGGQPWILGQFGNLRVTISYYIDSLTIVMFCMVTLIATCIHFYAMGYMHDELHDITDHEVHLSSGEDLKRPGRFPRFFQYLSLFCFSMLGLVLAGNIAMVFVFWELVGICSYFLIGFYVERKSASTAANKAFIVNRVGDFGMIIGLLALWSSLGTFAFGDVDVNKDGKIDLNERGLFSLVERAKLVEEPSAEHAAHDGHPADPTYQIVTPTGMIIAGAPKGEVASIAADHKNIPGGMENAKSEIMSRYRGTGYGYWLLVVAGIGIFCGCVGKSAQFPLHTWLPDAMEGPTPVSALVHSATMVAAGVYLVGRFFPVFCPEVLLVICIVGTITLFLAASIAITAVDIKRVLAYSTISQLGYMMLAIGLGGWVAGLMHLITHAFFKSLLFMCSGSVIHAVHTNDMRRMGGLLRKMPVTALTMLVGCLAIAGVGVPFVIGFSGYYSKDAILEQGFLFARDNGSPFAKFFFVIAAGGAAITSFYMFRMWYMTFVGKPRDQHAYDHAHESPPVMYLPLVLLATLAISVAWDWKLIGYGLIAAAFFVAKGIGEGWFKSKKTAHGHDDHGHGHDDHGHGHDDHGHSHGHDDHAHDDHSHAHGPSLTLTPAWTIAMIVTTVIGGWIIQQSLGDSIENIQVGGHRLGNLTLAYLLEDSRPHDTLGNTPARWLVANGKPWVWPNEHASHADAIKVPVTLLATGTWFAGITLATLMYALGYLNPEDVRRQFAPVYSLLWNKWWFDELYNWMWVKPTFVISRFISGIDKNWIDVFIDSLARFVAWFARAWEFIGDQVAVDGFVNLFAAWTYNLAVTLRQVQTGRIRQYVMFIVLGAIAVFVVVFLFWSPLATAQH
jgi:NADH:ubiquinone oxidoreductase subunit 5 (subunit L)/multisubunit Na+/H+ antiporter MnhA subunit